MAFSGLRVLGLFAVACFFGNILSSLPVLVCTDAGLGIVDVGDSVERFVLSFSHHSQKIFFLCVFRGSLFVVVILHEQNTCALLRLFRKTCRYLKRDSEVIERLEVEEKLAVAEKGSQYSPGVSAMGWEMLTDPRLSDHTAQSPRDTCRTS